MTSLEQQAAIDRLIQARFGNDGQGLVPADADLVTIGRDEDAFEQFILQMMSQIANRIEPKHSILRHRDVFIPDYREMGDGVEAGIRAGKALEELRANEPHGLIGAAPATTLIDIAVLLSDALEEIRQVFAHRLG